MVPLGMDPLANILAPVMTAEQTKSEVFVMLAKQKFYDD